jgi:hypothetical protein
MTTTETPSILLVSRLASADLTSYLGRAVKNDGSGKLELCGAGDESIGVLDNVDAAGDPPVGAADDLCGYAVDGRYSRAVSGAAIDLDEPVTPDANGKYVTAVDGDVVAGWCRKAASGADKYFILEIRPQAGIFIADLELLEIEVTISRSDVQIMNATPYELIPTPGAGLYLDVEEIHWFLDFNANAYDAPAAGDTLAAKYTNAAGAHVVDLVAGDVIGGAVADYHTKVQPVAELIPVANAPLVAHINVGEWFAAAGDSPLKARIQYRVRSLAF